jgi:cytosine/adenosine deaminase-related metal-dependent hydrolase
VVTRLLIDACDVVVTMDDAGTEVVGGSILVEDGAIVWVGSGAPPVEPDDRLDGRGTIAIPGLVNTHHHLFQTLTRSRAQDHGLFGWLEALYPVWGELDATWARVATLVGLAELALSGCTTTTDHHYLFPRGRDGVLEASIVAAGELGIRFHPTRGSMDLGVAQGGLPPDEVCQDTDEILAETEAAVRSFHDPSPGAMLRIAVAPCSPFSVSERLMRESAALARRLGVRLHTHLAETLEEEAYCRERYGRRPTELMDEWGWLGDDVWLAHCVHLDDDDVRRIARSGAGVAWCPSSNLRLGAGVAPARALLDAGGTVGLGVDGSASNDAGNLAAEVRQALLVTRGVHGAASLSAREALRVATRGGAACLGRDDIGSIAAGKRADLALFPADGLATAGSDADPVAGLVLCRPERVRHLLVEGGFVIRDGILETADEAAIARDGHRTSKTIAEGVGR